MNTIAVTGSSGFIGRHFCNWLLQHGHKPLQVQRNLLNGGPVADAIQGSQAVVHLAARAHQIEDEAADPVAAFRASNVELTLQVAKACVDSGVRRFVYVSSAGVLGNRSPPEGFDDASPSAPHDEYTRSKFEAEERLLAGFSQSLGVVILRPPIVYGPGAPGNFGRLIRAVSSGWPLPVGGLDAPRSMISVRNLCAVLTEAATNPRAAGLRMLVADRESTSILDLVRLIGDAAGRPVRTVPVSPALLETVLRLTGRGADVARLLRPFVLRCSVAKESLGWLAPYSLRQEIQWTVHVARQEARAA